MHAPILAVIKAELFEPFVKVLEDLEPAGLHADQHIGDPRLDRDRLVLALWAHTNHRGRLHRLLLDHHNSGPLECLASTVPRPRPWKLLAPRSQRCRMDDRRCLAHAVTARHVYRVSVTIVD